MDKLERNQGIENETCFDGCGTLLDPKYSVINYGAVQDQLTNRARRRGLTREAEVASLVHAVTCLDLTSLSGDDTSSNLQRLCHRAVNPIQKELLQQLGYDDPSEIHVAAVCVYPLKTSECVINLRTLKSSIPVASVAGGFPSGQSHLSIRLAEIKECIADGAKEIDCVINRELVLCAKWDDLLYELKLVRNTCGKATLKVILSAGELGTLSNVYKASIVSMAAGADFIKSSTGKEAVNATLPIGVAMARAIRNYHNHTGYKVGLKPAGGIRTVEDVLLWQDLVRSELGHDWMRPELFRIGASSLLGEIQQNLYEFVSGLQGSSKHLFPYM